MDGVNLRESIPPGTQRNEKPPNRSVLPENFRNAEQVEVLDDQVNGLLRITDPRTYRFKVGKDVLKLTLEPLGKGASFSLNRGTETKLTPETVGDFFGLLDSAKGWLTEEARELRAKYADQWYGARDTHPADRFDHLKENLGLVGQQLKKIASSQQHPANK